MIGCLLVLMLGTIQDQQQQGFVFGFSVNIQKVSSPAINKKAFVGLHASNNGNERAVSNSGSAGLLGGLYPSNFYQHPMIGYDCFYGYTFPNCTCTQHSPQKTATNKRNDDCYGPKCMLVKSDSRATTGNFTCGVKESDSGNNAAIVDCSHNANPNTDNAFYFSECNPYIPKPHHNRFLNTTSILNLFDHEFRFESIDESKSKTIVKCPLKRTPGSFLKGYAVQVDVHVHEVRDGFNDFVWVTHVFSCNSTAIEQQAPLGDSGFLQLVLVKNK